MKNLALILFMLIQLGDLSAQCPALTCNQATHISLDHIGSAYLFPEDLTEGNVSDCDLEVALYDISNTDQEIAFNDTLIVNCDFIGDYIVHVKDLSNQSICFGQISISDTLNFCTSSITEPLAVEIRPSKDLLSFSLLAHEYVEIQILNLTGGLLIKQTFSKSNFAINTSALPKGIYVLAIMADHKLDSKMIYIW